MLRTEHNSHPESMDSWEAKMTTLWQFEVRCSIFGQSPLPTLFIFGRKMGAFLICFVAILCPTLTHFKKSCSALIKLRKMLSKNNSMYGLGIAQPLGQGTQILQIYKSARCN